MCGNYDDGQKSGRDLIRFGEDAGDSATLCFGLEVLGCTQYLMGQLDEAISSLTEAIKLAEAVPDHATRICVGSELGKCYIRQNNLSAAMKTLGATEAYLNQHDMKYYFTSVFLRSALAEAHLFAAETSSGSERNAWLKQSKRSCKNALRSSNRYFRPLRPEAMRLQGTYKWLRGRREAAEKWWNKSLTLADSMGMPHYSGLAHFELGTRLGYRNHLEEASAIFERIGGAFDLLEVSRHMDKPG